MRVGFEKPEEGLFLERLNRFTALIQHEGVTGSAHIATSGRLRELLVPGARLLLQKHRGHGKKTDFFLLAVDHQGIWVSINAQLPNRLLEGIFCAGGLPPFAGCVFVRREPAYRDGRLDFLLAEEGQAVYVEVKSVTLVNRRVGLFPDAPTERGRRHLHHLAELVSEGCRAAVIFVVQRYNAESFAPNRETDPAFAAALQVAAFSGVEVYAYRCHVTPDGVTLAERIPVLL
jgi:sugar fermentation stimulation protein A